MRATSVPGPGGCSPPIWWRPASRSRRSPTPARRRLPTEEGTGCRLTRRRLPTEEGEWAGCYAGFCPGAEAPVTAIYLGRTLPCVSSGLPGNSASSLSVPCLTLLRARFTQQAWSPRPLVVSYTTVSPLPRRCVRDVAVCFLLHLLSGCPGWALPTALLCGARTFLGILADDATVLPTHSGRPVYRAPGRARSDAGFGGADEDAAALGVEDHLVGGGGPHGGEVGRVEGDVAAAGDPAAQQRCPDPVAGPLALVELD